MIRCVILALFLTSATPALAGGDELGPVPPPAVIGHAYSGETEPSRIRFINVRDRAVSIDWVSFDGGEKIYATLAPGEERVQPTFVAHRWLVKDAEDGTPLEAFISTRSAAEGIAQIALIR